MRIAVLGTGPVGQTVAARLELGHEVTVGTRDAEATMARTEADTLGRPPFSEWVADHPGIAVDPVADAAAAAELVVNAPNGAGSIATLEAAGAETEVAELLRSFGWSDVVDLEDITSARGTEMYLPLWARIWGATQNPAFSVKVVR